jgi:hypothetical protein
MLDWWTVRGERWGVRNLDFKIELKKDDTVGPGRLEGHSQRDLRAFDGGDWCFATVRLVPVDRDLNDLIHVEKFLRSVEWGEIPSGDIDRDDVTDEQACELALEAVRTLRIGGAFVDTEKDSRFAVERMMAPF